MRDSGDPDKESHAEIITILQEIKREVTDLKQTGSVYLTPRLTWSDPISASTTAPFTTYPYPWTTEPPATVRTTFIGEHNRRKYTDNDKDE
jgi:hypothetical protein